MRIKVEVECVIPDNKMPTEESLNWLYSSLETEFKHFIVFPWSLEKPPQVSTRIELNATKVP